MNKLAALLVVAAPFLGACADTPEEGDGIDDAFPDGKADGIDTSGALNAANQLTYDALVGAGLTRTAAHNIVAYRAGLDGKEATADDNLFDDLRELDAVRYVGPVSLAKLAAAAKKLGLDGPLVKARCVEITRSFTITSSGGKLAATFVDFDKSLEKLDCVPWTKGTMKYRCYGDVAHPPFYQASVERTATNKPAVLFDLVNEKDEQGDTYLFTLSCSSVLGF